LEGGDHARGGVGYRVYSSCRSQPAMGRNENKQNQNFVERTRRESSGDFSGNSGEIKNYGSEGTVSIINDGGECRDFEVGGLTRLDLTHKNWGSGGSGEKPEKKEPLSQEAIILRSPKYDPNIPEILRELVRSRGHAIELILF